MLRISIPSLILLLFSTGLITQGAPPNVVFILSDDQAWTDYGFMGHPHQESIRVPLIIDDPRMSENIRGKTNDDFTLNVDLAPTILAAAGIDAPKTMQGKDLSLLYFSEQKPEWRDEFFYEHPMIKSTDFIPASEALVRKDWKYFYWPEFDREQLFDLKADPREENDLATDPKHSDKLVEMRTRFTKLKAAAN